MCMSHLEVGQCVDTVTHLFHCAIVARERDGLQLSVIDQSIGPQFGPSKVEAVPHAGANLCVPLHPTVWPTLASLRTIAVAAYTGHNEQHTIGEGGTVHTALLIVRRV